VARTIHCTVVEVPAMADPYLPQPREFQDLVPWADPYIASLLHKLQRSARAEGLHAAVDTYSDYNDDVVNDLPPPLDKNDRQDQWRPDWSHRNWPRG
jgi:hypothetical protein